MKGFPRKGLAGNSRKSGEHLCDTWQDTRSDDFDVARGPPSLTETRRRV
jgi:hypothetical protein